MAEHHIVEIATPIAIIVRCSCGWTKEITRKQNAYARAAKVKSAIRHHEVTQQDVISSVPRDTQS